LCPNRFCGCGVWRGERAVYSGAEELNGQRCPGNHADPSWDRVQSPLFSAWEEGGAEAQVA